MIARVMGVCSWSKGTLAGDAQTCAGKSEQASKGHLSWDLERSNGFAKRKNMQKHRDLRAGDSAE